MTGRQVPRNRRNEILDYLSYWHKRTGVALGFILRWLALTPSKYYNWKRRYNLENQHNGSIPKTHWLLAWEINAIINYRFHHMDEGYRRLTYQMLDEDIVAVSASHVRPQADRCTGFSRHMGCY